MILLKWIRFVLRLILLVVAIISGIAYVKFLYQFRFLTFEQVSDLVNVVSSKPIPSLLIGMGVILFILSLLGLIMLLQYQVWRYPLSIFVGYGVGIFVYYHFYLMHPLQESLLQLNDIAWYYPLVIASALLLRALVGIKIPYFKKSNLIASN